MGHCVRENGLRDGALDGRPDTAPKAGAIRQRKRRHDRKTTSIWITMALCMAGCVALLLTSFCLRVRGESRKAAMEGTPLPQEGGQEEQEESPKLVSMEEALKVKGLYVTMDTFGTPSRIAPIFKFIEEHKGLNALVVDVKDNSGRVPCQPPEGIPSKAQGYGHFEGLVKVLKREGYYMIARIVAFQDPWVAQARPEQAIRKSDGSLWRDRDGRLWLNPYDKRNWEFVRDLALWAQGMGFDEIQLDYVRFPDSAAGLEKSGVLMPGNEEFQSRGEAIVAFLEFMSESLKGKAYLSADIFGFTTIAQDDMGIGQKIEDVASSVDFVCPMVYPSHYYNSGIYGFETPEAHPGEVVSQAMAQAIQRTAGERARIRPWLQDFSMKIEYGPEEVQAQIDSAFSHGIETFLLWNPANTYTRGVRFQKGE